jgi:hypothetical protein
LGAKRQIPKNLLSSGTEAFYPPELMAFYPPIAAADKRMSLSFYGLQWYELFITSLTET